ncbi:MAG TPA: hypothetical protein VGJ26_15615 [Pirellulales bacterium]|jgi:hypothetical protein
MSHASTTSDRADASEATAQSAAAPVQEYRRRLALWNAAATRAARTSAQITSVRRVVLLLVIGYVVFDPTEIQALAPLAIVVIPSAFVQNIVIRRWKKASRAASYYQLGLARLEDHWIGRGVDGRQYLESANLYADDLDVFGRGSLFELLCTSETPMGQDTLARWLTTQDPLGIILARQQGVRRLRDNLDLRESLSAIDLDLRGVRPSDAIRWGAAEPILRNRLEKALGMATAWGLVAGIVLTSTVGGHQWPLVLVPLGLATAFHLWRRHATREVCRHTGAAGRCLGVLFELRQALRGRASDAPAALAEIAARLDRGLGFPNGRAARAYGVLLQGSVLHALAVQLFPPLDGWRVNAGGDGAEGKRAEMGLADAIAAGGELEALAALSAYAYEHPDDPFPQFVEEGPCFNGEGLGHPLMPRATCVRNDVSLGGERRLILISGSNMSGKSTLLRTVGVNAVLALAGAPVRATRLEISPLSTGAAMRFRDSVHEGASYFYAVLRRLRDVLALTADRRPLLFLFDEILQGTNSQDRLLGAEAIMRRLLDAGAIGLMTTHDLALTQIVADLAPRGANMHCEDQLVDGQMSFDYKLRPGVVTKSNAVALMRSMGLDV